MVTAEELTVAIRSEGVSETQQDLQGVESTMEDTAESAGDSADQLEGFSQQFAGAMSAAVAALAVGAAGLMSQVPVLGEAFSGLGAIVDALALKMDSFLRSIGAGGLTTALFDLANAIYETDGAAGQLVGGITTIGSVLAIAIPAVAKIGSLFGVWSSTGAGVISILTTMGSTLTGIIGTITGFVAGSAAAVAAIGALIGIMSVAVLEVTGVMDAVRGLGQMVGQALPQWVTDGMLALTTVFLAQFAVIGGLINGFVQGFLEGGLKAGVEEAIDRGIEVLGVFVGAWSRTLDRASTLIGDLLGVFTSFAGDMASWAGDLADQAYDWGVDFISGLLAGVMSLIDPVVNAITGAINGIISLINDTINQLPDFITSRIGISEIDQIDFDTNVLGNVDFAGAGGRGGGERRGLPQGFRTRGRPTGGGAQIDGRQLSESTGRYRSDPGRRRGL